MVSGTGSFVYSQRDVAGGAAPPFAANSAANGLSVNGAGQIVLGDALGGGLADLLDDREIEMAGFLFKFINGGSDILLLDPANDTYIIGDINQTYLFNDAFGFEISSGGVPSVGMNVMDFTFGDYNATQNKTYLDVDDTQQLIRMFFGSDPYLVLDKANDVYALGDYNNYVNPVITAEVAPAGPITTQYAQNAAGTLTAYQEVGVVNGSIQPRFLVELTGTTTNSEINLVEDVFAVSFDNGGTTDPYLILDRTTQNYALGDYANFVNPVIGTFTQAFFNGTYMNAIWAANNSSGAIGMDIGSASNQPNIYNNITIGGDGSRTILDLDKFEVVHNTAQLLALDWSQNKYVIGDYLISAPLQNGNYLEIDDTANIFRITNTLANAGIEINGVAGFTGTVAAPATITVNNGIVTNVA